MIRIFDLGPISCGPDIPTRDVLRRVEASVHKFQIIVDGEGRLLGTVTDGDIRRAMLAGAAIDDPVRVSMHTTPVTGRPEADEENASRLRVLPFLPIVDPSGVVREILVPGAVSDSVGSALVMAGGAGRRLGDRTRNTPKPLLPIDGKPILDRILTVLENEGIREIYIAVHYLADQIESFVMQRENQAGIELLREDAPLGTAGAIGLLPQMEDPILVLNGDVITKVDFSALRSFHGRHRHDATIAVARYDVEIPYGVVQHTSDGLFESIREKPTMNYFVAAGVYYLAPEFCALAPRNRAVDMPELLDLGRRAGLSIGLFPIHEYWIDVGQPHDLLAADRDLRDAR